MREALGDEAAYIDYVRPGSRWRGGAAPGPAGPECARGLVLGKHGLIAWGDTARDCYDSLLLLINRAEAFVASGSTPRRPARRAPFRPQRRRPPRPAERRAAAARILPHRCARA